MCETDNTGDEEANTMGTNREVDNNYDKNRGEKGKRENIF